MRTAEIFKRATNETSYSEIGVRFFVKASMEYPASFSHQAATIALICREYPNAPSPAKLLRAILSDKTQIEKLANVANAVHTRSNKAPRVVSKGSVENVLQKDFDLAEEMRVVPIKDLRKFISETPHEGFGNALKASLKAKKVIREYRKNKLLQFYRRKIRS